MAATSSPFQWPSYASAGFTPDTFPYADPMQFLSSMFWALPTASYGRWNGTGVSQDLGYPSGINPGPAGGYGLFGGGGVTSSGSGGYTSTPSPVKTQQGGGGGNNLGIFGGGSYAVPGTTTETPIAGSGYTGANDLAALIAQGYKPRYVDLTWGQNRVQVPDIGPNDIVIGRFTTPSDPSNANISLVEQPGTNLGNMFAGISSTPFGSWLQQPSTSMAQNFALYSGTRAPQLPAGALGANRSYGYNLQPNTTYYMPVMYRNAQGGYSLRPGTMGGLNINFENAPR